MEPQPVQCPPAAAHVMVAAENQLLREVLIRVPTKPKGIDVKVLLLRSNGIAREDLNTIQQVRASLPDARILLLALTSNEAEFLRCVRAGVSGYLREDASGQELLQAIDAVAAGARVCPASLCGALFRYLATEAPAVASSTLLQK